MSKALEMANSYIISLEAIEDSPQYREEWDLGGDAHEFDQSIEERIAGVVGEYAVIHHISWEDANESLIQYRIENPCHLSVH